jgi:cyanophycinase
MSGSKGLFGLLGSGEFEPWSAAVDGWLLERATGDGTVLILPTASAPEGDDVFDGWAAMGSDHFAGSGVTSEVLPVKTRREAENEAFARRVGEASMVYFSGGNPAYLAGTLADTRLWRAVLDGLARGMAYAGCSAGISSLGDTAPDSSVRSIDGRTFRPGLRLFPNVQFGPHWDALDRYLPGLRGIIEASVPPSARLLAVDEHTAAVGDGTSWVVMGRGSAHLRQRGAWRSFPTGAAFTVDLTTADGVTADGALSS